MALAIDIPNGPGGAVTEMERRFYATTGSIGAALVAKAVTCVEASDDDGGGFWATTGDGVAPIVLGTAT